MRNYYYFKIKLFIGKLLRVNKKIYFTEIYFRKIFSIFLKLRGIAGIIYYLMNINSIRVMVNMKGPKLNKEQKKKLIKRFTQAASEVTEIPEEAFVVLLEEMEQDNVGVGGEMLSERKE